MINEPSAAFFDFDGTLEPGSYMAVVSRPPEVPVGIPGAEEVASLHVITGTW